MQPPLTHKDVLLSIPLAPGQFVGDFNSIAVRVMEIYANGNAVVADMLNGEVFFLGPVVKLLQVIEALHHPGHMVQPHLTVLNGRGVLAYLNQGYFVGLFNVRRHKSGPSGHKIVRMQTQNVLIPLLRALGVADKKVYVAQELWLVGHFLTSSQIRYFTGCLQELPINYHNDYW